MSYQNLSAQSIAPGEQQLEPFLPAARRLLWPAFILAIANGIFLYGFPTLAKDWFAWSINPPINAAFQGVGYLVGILVTGMGLFTIRSWLSIRAFVLPFAALSFGLFVTTLLHADKFHWLYPLTWIWTAVYAFIPPVTLLAWRKQQARAVQAPPREKQLNVIILICWVLGIPITLGALLSLFWPDLMISIWPWQITPLLARVFACWYLMTGALLLFCALKVRQPFELVIPCLWVVLTSLFHLTLLLRFPNGISTTSASLWAGVALYIFIILSFCWFLIQSILWMREKGQRL
jgi:hypothetical protein